MTNLQKQILFWLGAILLVVISVFFIVSINQKYNTAATTNIVSFNGEGKVSAKPDVAVAYLSIVTEAVTSKAAQDANTTKSNNLITFLKNQKVADKDIKTTGYNIYPQYNYPRSGAPTIKGYQVNQTVEVKIRDLENASKILDGVVTAGVNQINQLSFEIDEPEKLKDQARQKAIDDAKSKADALKNQLGIKLGRIINFTEGTYGYPMPYAVKDLSVGGIGGGGETTPSVPSGENEITVNVTITYQIK
jgi:hypothetical protein